jgi:creatinine amidohydrolase
MKLVVAGVAVLAAVAAGPGAPQTPPAARGVALADLAWPDAEPWLTASTVVVIPLGAGAVEQGPHMKLNSGERLARHLTARVQAASAVVVAPMLTYHAYAPYAAYPGSTSLGDTVARDLTVDAVRSLAAFGPRRFYVLNTSSAPIGALQAASRTLADAGILLGYTDPGYWTKRTGVLKQSPTDVGHADEAFTSMMLFVDPASVDMTRAAREYPVGRGALTRVEGGRGRVSPSGVIGDATLAIAPKGRTLVDALAAGMLEDIESIRQAPLPAAAAAAAASGAPERPWRVHGWGRTRDPAGRGAVHLLLGAARRGGDRKAVCRGRRHPASRRFD